MNFINIFNSIYLKIFFTLFFYTKSLKSGILHLGRISIRTSLIAQWPRVATGYGIGQCAYRTFPTSQKLLLDSLGLAYICYI